jgi:hypothetical protein
MHEHLAAACTFEVVILARYQLRRKNDSPVGTIAAYVRTCIYRHRIDNLETSDIDGLRYHTDPNFTLLSYLCPSLTDGIVLSFHLSCSGFFFWVFFGPSAAGARPEKRDEADS